MGFTCRLVGAYLGANFTVWIQFHLLLLLHLHLFFLSSSSLSFFAFLLLLFVLLDRIFLFSFFSVFTDRMMTLGLTKETTYDFVRKQYSNLELEIGKFVSDRISDPIGCSGKLQDTCLVLRAFASYIQSFQKTSFHSLTVKNNQPRNINYECRANSSTRKFDNDVAGYVDVVQKPKQLLVQQKRYWYCLCLLRVSSSQDHLDLRFPCLRLLRIVVLQREPYVGLKMLFLAASQFGSASV